MKFDRQSYVMSHGKEPRGRGTWAFCPTRHKDSADYLAHTVFAPADMSLADAKRWVAQQPVFKNVYSVTIMP